MPTTIMAIATPPLARTPIPHQAIDTFMDRIGRTYEVVDGYLFGSRARGDAVPCSDADVAIILRGAPGNFLATKLAMADIAYDVLLETAVHIQPLPIWEEEWLHPADYSNPLLLHNIAREGMRV